MPYRTNAKKDMIIELNDSEIKKACIEYINSYYDIFSQNNNEEDVVLYYDTEKR